MSLFTIEIGYQVFDMRMDVAGVSVLDRNYSQVVIATVGQSIWHSKKNNVQMECSLGNVFTGGIFR